MSEKSKKAQERHVSNNASRTTSTTATQMTNDRIAETIRGIENPASARLTVRTIELA